MRDRKRKGFTLFFVVIFLTLMGLFLAVLGNTSSNYAGEALEKILRSNCRQLLASGMAWSGRNPDKVVDLGQDGTFQLDVNAFNVRDANCIVKLVKVADDIFEVEITASCAKGWLDVRRSTRVVFTRGIENRIVYPESANAALE